MTIPTILRAVPGVLLCGALLSSPVALGYTNTATVSFTFGGNDGGTAIAGSVASSYPTTQADLSWTSNGPNSLGVMSNSTYFTGQGGFNGYGFYNTDFATASQCNTLTGGATTSVRKYGCRYTDVSSNPSFISVPVTGNGPVARASGTLVVTDTTLTGMLTLDSTTDQATGAIANVTSPYGAKVSTAPGVGTDGYNYRAADGSPFGNYWQGTTTLGTYAVNLTGTFTPTSWNITGGTALYIDPGFLCQQGGNGNLFDPVAGSLCTAFGYAGVHQHNGAHLSWGWDTNGQNGGSQVSQIEVRDATGSSVVTLLSGVLASLSVDGGGNITTNAGEFRRASDPTVAGCGTSLRWDGSKISCGSLTTGRLDVTGTVAIAPVPLPAAAWFLGGALGLLGALRRRPLP
ncbi:MAG: hypothetical protein ABL989_14095 [Gammaproteobacteria bacterium]